MDNRGVSCKQAEYEAWAKETGFSSVLELAASNEMPKWGSVDYKYVIVDIPLSSVTCAMMNDKQKGLLEFLREQGEVSSETVKSGNIKFNRYVAGSKLSEIIRQEKSKCQGLCRR